MSNLIVLSAVAQELAQSHFLFFSGTAVVYFSMKICEGKIIFIIVVTKYTMAHLIMKRTLATGIFQTIDLIDSPRDSAATRTWYITMTS